MNYRFPLSLFLISVCGVSSIASDVTENWPHWRGPAADGRASANAAPPTAWNAENVRWTFSLPGEGTSTPIVWEDRIFVLSAESTDREAETPVIKDQRSKTQQPENYYRFIVTCVSRSTGNLLWQKTAVEEVPHEGHHPTHTYAGSSPTTDGERLYVSFGSRGIFCFSLNGDLIWNTDLGNMRTRYGWGESVTPVVDGSNLIINWDQEEGSFITCLDAATGNEKWKTMRPGEVTSWNTPLVTTLNHRTYVIANGTERVRAYDMADGREVWNCGGQTVNAIPSLIRVDDFVIAMSGYRGSNAMAIPVESSGEIAGRSALRWQHARGTPYVPSPVVSGNRLLFTGGNRDILTVLDVRSGRPLREPLRLSGLGTIYASPILANGHFYFLGRNGTCIVLKDDESLTVVAVNRLNDATDASPVVVGNDLLIRSWKKLYCVTN